MVEVVQMKRICSVLLLVIFSVALLNAGEGEVKLMGKSWAEFQDAALKGVDGDGEFYSILFPPNYMDASLPATHRMVNQILARFEREYRVEVKTFSIHSRFYGHESIVCTIFAIHVRVSRK